ncbi:related to fructosyl amino acid oxidase [Phialocephala subalpina]|uniref:Related to fructosyl amino acid oxidase n=1 Tax=Phialocephala subalpina TaxID=576137 RepID=A0A1L7XUD1_9HELO|nr:related to fructosyl amino acid oxidase [Phialocephala subalpina]
MADKTLSKTAPILIVGAGVFGLSTALHLGQRGYKNVTVIDKQDYDKTLYSYDNGYINKVLRCAYGADTIYTNLALSAREVFLEWNAELSNSGSSPPLSLTSKNTMYVNCSTLSMINREEELPPFERQSLDYLKSIGKSDSQFIVNNAEDIARAGKAGFGQCVDPFNRKSRGLPHGGLLDTLGGLVYADKSCLFAMHKAKPGAEEQDTVAGVRTANGVEHLAALTIVAGGGWTPTTVPELDNLCETTAGSVVSYRIPRSSPLWDRFAPEKFPSYQIGMRDGAEGGVYGFPRDLNGIVKIGYRGTKYTNPIVQGDGKERSTPITRWTAGTTLTAIPSTALRVIKTFVAKNLPELNEHNIPIVKSRLCWYNDSFDNHLVVDRVPSRKNLMVATGGSGHGFTYLPVLGKWIVDIIEGKELVGADKEIKKRWQWRSLPDGEKAYNVIMQAVKGREHWQGRCLLRMRS